MQTALIAFDVAARILKKPVDMNVLGRAQGIGKEELNWSGLIGLAREAGIRTRKIRFKGGRLPGRFQTPCLAKGREGDFRVILQVNDAKKEILVFSVVDKSVRTHAIAELPSLFSEAGLILSDKTLLAGLPFGYSWFLQEFMKHKQMLAETLVASFFLQSFALAAPLFLQVIIDKVLNHGSMSTLKVISTAFMGIICFEFALNLCRNYIFGFATSKIDARLGSNLYKHLLRLPILYFESRKVGNIVSRVRELDAIREFISQKSVTVFMDLFFSTVSLAFMFAYSPRLALIVVGFVSAIGLMFLVITPEWRRRLERKFQMGAASNSFLVESVNGIQTVKALAVEGSMHRKWEEQLGTYIASSFKLSNMSGFTVGLSTFMQRIMTLAILYFGVLAVLADSITIGQLVAFQMFGQFTGPILRLVGLWNEFQQNLLSVERLGDILNSPTEAAGAGQVSSAGVKGAIRFENVAFRYKFDGQEVLKGIDLDIPEGTSYGIVGKSGSGKSTVTKLIQRMYLATSGCISVDGMDIRHLHPAWLRSSIGVVLQENYLFSGSIRENLLLAKPDASMEEMLAASHLAGAHEFIQELPEGYETPVGERGSFLSGGQRQRVSIARALITNPRILILDEATSALDYESEAIIMKNLERIKRGRTLILISHKLTAVQGCDRIIVLDRGKIIEQGDHAGLLSMHGFYRQYFDNQQGGSYEKAA